MSVGQTAFGTSVTSIALRLYENHQYLYISSMHVQNWTRETPPALRFAASTSFAATTNATIRGISSRVFNKKILMKSHRKQYLIEHERYKCVRLSKKGTNKIKYLRNRRYFSAGKIQHEKILIQTNLV